MVEAPTLLRDYAWFLRRHWAWWALPPLLILAGLAALVWFTARTDVTGFVYNV